MSGTTVNGGAAFVANGVKDDFALAMGAGDDVVRLEGNTTVPDDIVANMGEGANTFWVSPDSGDVVVVVGDLTVIAGSGADLLRLWYATSIGGDVKALLGDGDNEVQVWNDTVIHGHLKIESGSGEDEIGIWNDSEIHGNVNLSTGAGDDEVMVWNETVLHGKLRVLMGAGQDEIDIWNNATLLGRVSVDTGEGDDLVDIRNEAHLAGKLDIRTGDGCDTVSIVGSGGDVTLAGQVTISTDNKTAGNDVVTVSDAAFDRNLKIDTASAAGLDTVSVDSVTVGGKVDILTAGTDPDGDTVQIDSLTADRLKVHTGGGNDNVVMVFSTINKQAFIRTEEGVDFVTLAANNFLNSLKVRLGGGDDTLATASGGNTVGRRTDLHGGKGYDTLDMAVSDVFNGEKIKEFENITY